MDSNYETDRRSRNNKCPGCGMDQRRKFMDDGRIIDSMFKTTLKIDGMMCGMCEAHIADVIRKKVPNAKKVSASHSKGIATFLSEDAPSEDELKEAIAKTGYTCLEVNSETYVKKGLFGR